MMRTFVALPVPAEIGELLAVAQAGLPVGRPVPVENMHLTLAFLGERPEPLVEDVHHALTEVSGGPLSLRIDGVGMFGAAKPRSVHARVPSGPELRRLRQGVQAAVRQAGIALPREKFVPHITLARFSRPPGADERLALESWLGRRMDLGSRGFVVTEFGLYRSWLSAAGARYEPLATYPLAVETDGPRPDRPAPSTT